MAMPETYVPPFPRIQVARARDVPPGAVRVFGSVLWRNRYGYRSRHGLARVPAALDEGAAWEYEGRCTAAGADHAFHHPDGRITAHKVRYMTRRECQETYRRVLTGELTPELEHHRPLASIPEIVEALKGKVLACTCPFPRDGKDWCHAADLAWLADTHEVARLDCLSLKAARLVADEADRPGTHRAVASGSKVFVSYFDKRYPLDIAEWAFSNGHCDDSAAGDVIARL